MKQAVLDGLADILEASSPLTPDTKLAEAGAWDSLAVVCTIALLDDKCGASVDGKALASCETAGDVLRLAGLE